MHAQMNSVNKDDVPLEFILICVRGPINTEGLVRDLRSATNGSCNRSGFSPKFHCNAFYI